MGARFADGLKIAAVLLKSNVKVPGTCVVVLHGVREKEEVLTVAKSTGIENRTPTGTLVGTPVEFRVGFTIATRKGGLATYVKPPGKRASPLALLTRTSTGPAVPGGVVIPSVVKSMNEITPTSWLPRKTLEFAVKPLPLMVIALPPSIEPLSGVTEVMTGGAPVGAVTVNGKALDIRPLTFTVTVVGPGPTPTGTAALMLNTVELMTVAVTPPKLTIFSERVELKAVPVIVTSRVGGPETGSIAAIVGLAASMVNVCSTAPPGVVMMSRVAPIRDKNEMSRHTSTLVSEVRTLLIWISGSSVVTVAPRKFVPVMVMHAVSPAWAVSWERLSMVGACRQSVLRVIARRFPTAS